MKTENSRKSERDNEQQLINDIKNNLLDRSSACNDGGNK